MNDLNSLVLEDLICRHLHMYLHTIKPRFTEITSSIMRFYLPIIAKREKYLDKYSYFNILYPCYVVNLSFHTKVLGLLCKIISPYCVPQPIENFIHDNNKIWFFYPKISWLLSINLCR